MRKFVSLAFIVTVVALLSSALGGCTNQTREANKQIDKYNARITKYNTLDEEASELMKKVNTQAQTKEEFAQNVEILEQVESKISQQSEELTEASKSLEEARDLEISEGFKTYIEMELTRQTNSFPNLPTKWPLSSRRCMRTWALHLV